MRDIGWLRIRSWLVKGLLLLHLAMFLSVETLPQYSLYFHIDIIELNESSESESKSEEKEKDNEGLKEYLIGSIGLFRDMMVSKAANKNLQFGLIDCFFVDIVTPPPDKT